VPRAECVNCGSKLPTKSRFCPECGARVGASPEETAVQELPPDETGPVPVERIVVQRRLFGVTPPTALFGLGLAGVALSILLLATGHWIWGLFLLVAGLLLLAGFGSMARRLPDDTTGLARAPLAAFDAVRARAGAAVETVAAHGSARIELAGLRRDAGELAAERGQLLRELGEAVYEGNKTATKDGKKRIKELDEAIQAKEAEMTNVALAAQERIGKAQLRVQPTEILPGGEEIPGEAPEPAQVPEPMPPPDEGQPPEPARIPEPYPPPDEGDRPQQPAIPEPGPE